MPVNLTPNVIVAVIGDDLKLKSLVHVVDIKLIGRQERYQFMVSDDILSQHAMISSQLNDRIKNNRVQIGSIVQLTEYICTGLQNRHSCVLVYLLVMVSLSTLIAFFIRAAFDNCDRGSLDVIDKRVPLGAPIGTSPSPLSFMKSKLVLLVSNELSLSERYGVKGI
ncbi:hypothetical protein ACFX2I_028812 [Malus domestica]